MGNISIKEAKTATDAFKVKNTVNSDVIGILSHKSLDELVTALDNDTYNTLQSLLKDETDEWNNENVELADEAKREMFEEIKEMHRERMRIYNSYAKNEVG